MIRAWRLQHLNMLYKSYSSCCQSQTCPKSWLKSEQPERAAKLTSCQYQSLWTHQDWVALMTLEMSCALARLTCLTGWAWASPHGQKRMKTCLSSGWRANQIHQRSVWSQLLGLQQDQTSSWACMERSFSAQNSYCWACLWYCKHHCRPWWGGWLFAKDIIWNGVGRFDCRSWRLGIFASCWLQRSTLHRKLETKWLFMLWSQPNGLVCTMFSSNSSWRVKLSSLKSRMELNHMMQRMPDPRWVCQNLRCKYTTKYFLLAICDRVCLPGLYNFVWIW